MATTDGTGLTKGKAFRIKLKLVRGGKILNLSGYTVAATARFATSLVEFVPGISVLDATGGIIEITGTSGQMNNVPANSDWLDLELAFGGTPTINPNARAIRVPVRPLYGAFVAP